VWRFGHVTFTRPVVFKNLQRKKIPEFLGKGIAVEKLWPGMNIQIPVAPSLRCIGAYIAEGPV
jgi:hypothetical protein